MRPLLQLVRSKMTLISFEILKEINFRFSVTDGRKAGVNLNQSYRATPSLIAC